MTKKTQAMRKVILLFVGAIVVCLPSVATAAKERKSPLTDAPVIRRRLELRDKRFELGVGAGVTIGQDFYNALLIMPKLAYHFNDWISLAVGGGFNPYPGWKSSFNDDVGGALPKDPNIPSIKSPYAADALATMNYLKYTAFAQLEFIPLSGKIAILSSLFSYFDFYVLGGAGVVNLAAKEAMPAACASETGDPNRPKCEAYTATELTINAGLGAHAFFARWGAINLELRDLIYKNNASGRDVNGDGVTDRTHDPEWTNNWVFSLNFQFFLPTKAKVSR
jgi:outer membrane beta-barrel protein